MIVTDRMHNIFRNSHYDKHEYIRNTGKIVVGKPEGTTGISG
jgi:S-adenosylmethionine synthetase